MAEYSKEKLYFLKLPKDFFQSYKMRALEGISGGRDYELMYLKLLCESISHNGYLRFDEKTPYTVDMIAGITNTPIDSVRVGIEVLQKFGLVEVTDTKSIYLPEVSAMTGSTTVGAKKKQEQIASRNEGVERKVEKIPPREIRELDNGMSTNVSIPTENSRESTEPPNGNSVSSRKNQYEQVRNNELLGMMVQIGFLNESETEDPCWEKFLKDFIQERQDVLGDKDGYVDAKIKLKYVLGSISTVSKGPLDRNGKQIFIRKVDPIIMATIGAKFPWFIKAMKRAVEQQEAALRMAEEFEGFLDNASNGEGEQQ